MFALCSLTAFSVILQLSTCASLRKFGGPYVPASGGSSPSCARGTMTFCESVDKYPSDLIKSLLQAKPFNVSSLFTDESEGLQEPPELVLYQEAPYTETSRQKRSLPDPGNSCNRALNVMPKTAMNSNGQWRYIIQDSEADDFKNSVHVTLCSDDTTCRNCKQQMQYVTLLSLDPSGSLKKDLFLMPNNCRCRNQMLEKQNT